MARLSHIEDFEDGAAERADGQTGGKPSHPGGDAGEATPIPADVVGEAAPGGAGAGAAAVERMPQTASDELAWHGLDEHEGGGGQKAIAVVALVVLAAVVLYVLNYWLHIF